LEFRGAGRNFSPDSISVYIGLYEWSGNQAKKETQRNILKWTIGKQMSNFNRPNMHFWELGDYFEDNVQLGNEDRKFNLVDGD
jgi:hypothetical protein